MRSRRAADSSGPHLDGASWLPTTIWRNRPRRRSNVAVPYDIQAHILNPSELVAGRAGQCASAVDALPGSVPEVACEPCSGTRATRDEAAALSMKDPRWA